MTLHWWMHWFWVTAQIVVCLSNPTMELPMETTRTMSVLADTTAVDPSVTTTPAAATPTTTTAATITTTTTANDTTSTGDPTSDGNSTTSISPADDALARLQQSYRINKATGLQNVTGDNATGSEKSETSTNSSMSSTSTEQPMQADATTSIYLDRFRPIEINTNRTVIIPASAENNRTVQEPSRISNVNTKKENKISWISVLNPPVRPNREENSSDAAESISPSTTSSSHEILTVMPLQVNTDYSVVEHNNNNNNVRRNRTAEQLLGDPQNTGELQAVATAASVFEAGYGDSTRLGRARGAFTSEFQREQVASSREDSAKELIEPVSVSKNTVSSGRNITEIATITGSCLAVIVLLSSVGSVSFIMYRRKYLNPPQTLNSDKCSNPDSSGYIDDSTIRDNSEEMYSLDNDSFLNSLEAMTIQNYWTDVKHTKL
ncbi:cell wall protein DAN4 isoform X2 [Trichogramma pretiosum]|nr:cell wall protein DAN4 isoform X2 [Trichogramma pretiosum]XP_023319424.1 cell wall protein DAN4 isoform X2 [Trichogramma pretiosum]XP_023319425.1 cell wall protein DAN4 isoform X2 [Trichogramma pretiosum]